MTVGGHCNQITLLILSRFQDSSRGIAEREKSVHLQSTLSQRLGGTFQVCAVALHLFGFGQAKLIVIAGSESVGDVDQEQIRAVYFRELGDVRQERLVRPTVFQSDENSLIHD